ncbi:hypothetical protein IH799_04155 [candidate division KSB1 bacterium]|nr:hypothetical protein [candidate division KSB1 bacterium]
MFKAGNFTLGKFAKPVFVSAVIWLIFEIGILTIPDDFHTTTMVSGLLVILGVICYFLFFKSRLNDSALDRARRTLQ